MFPFGPGVSICVSISETGKWLGSKGLRKCFQCFQLFPRIGPEYIKSSLQVFFQNSSENMETLETSLETTGTQRVSVRTKWKHKWKQLPKWKHLACQPQPGPQRSQFRCSTESIGLAACIYSSGVHYDEQIHDDKTSGERTGSVSGNCVQVGAWRHHPGQAIRKTNHQDSVRGSRALTESEPTGSSELDQRRRTM